MDINLAGLTYAAYAAGHPARLWIGHEDAYYARLTWDWQTPRWIGRLLAAVARRRLSLDTLAPAWPAAA